jgi:hypothetical protein
MVYCEFLGRAALLARVTCALQCFFSHTVKMQHLAMSLGFDKQAFHVLLSPSPFVGCNPFGMRSLVLLQVTTRTQASGHVLSRRRPTTTASSM